MLNSVNMQGRIGNDLELKTTPNGTSVTQFRIAVQRNYKNESGEYAADWFSCVAWRGTAEFICKHFAKGSMILLMGELQSRSYENEGRKVYVTEIVVSGAYFTEKRQNGGSAPLPPEPPARATTADENFPEQTSEQFAPVAADDDYPF